MRPRGSWDEAASKIFLSASILLLVFENHHGDLTNFSSKKKLCNEFYLITSRAAAFHFQRYFLLGDQSVSVCRAQFVLILIRISVRKFKSNQRKSHSQSKKYSILFEFHDK